MTRKLPHLFIALAAVLARAHSAFRGRRARRFYSMLAAIGLASAGLVTFGLQFSVGRAASVSFVQEAGGTEAAAATTLTVTFTTATVAGDLLVVEVSMYAGSSKSITSITDTTTGSPNTWQAVTGNPFIAGMGVNNRGETWYSITGSADSAATIHFSTSTAAAATVLEFSGVAAIDQAKGQATATSSTTADSGTTAALSSTGELAVGAAMIHATNGAIAPCPGSPCSGYTATPQRDSMVPSSLVSVRGAYKLTAGTATEDFTATVPSDKWASSVATFTAAATPTPTPTVTATPTPPLNPYCAASPISTISKVMVIVEENHDYSTIIGPGAPTTNAPNINTYASDCLLLRNYWSQTHPSLPNYLELTAGSVFEPQSSWNDCSPSVSCQVTPTAGSSPVAQSRQSLFELATSAGWKSYEEDMPSACSMANSGNYAVRHNPAAYYTAIPSTVCSADDVPMGSTSAGSLHDDVVNATLPQYSFVTPNTVNDMHDGSDPSRITTADTWLKGWIDLVTDPTRPNSDYNTGKLLIEIVWDEGSGSTDNQLKNIPCIFMSKHTKQGTFDGYTTHFTSYKLAQDVILGAAGLDVSLGLPNLF